MPKNIISEPIVPLPSKIKSGSTVKGIPKEIKIHYLKRRRTRNSDTYENVDSGERYVTFEFNKSFPQVVYVTTIIDLSTHTNQIFNIERNIENRHPIKLNINDELKISIPVTSK